MIATRLWTVDDLAERWGVSREEVERQIKEAKLPFISFKGRGGEAKRFRPSAVEAWEAERQRVEGQPEGEQLPPAGVVPGWDGKSRLSPAKGKRRRGG